jgi:flavin-dependent thymidylate synthase
VLSVTDGEVLRWADAAMYRAVPTANEDGGPVVPRVTLIHMTANPLKVMAAAAEMYRGQPVRSADEVSDDTARHWFEEMSKTRLQAPFEFIDLHFLIEGVTRAFTHQLVRQRTAVYVQESQRFAVKENGEHEVGLPPSLAGTRDWEGFRELHEPTIWDKEDFLVWAERNEPEQALRFRWDEAVAKVVETYNQLVNMGMPAEDARGLLPTNITTRIHYKTNLRNLAEHAGNRLCTQAQFEWRLVWAEMIKAIRQEGKRQQEILESDSIYGFPTSTGPDDITWQYDLIASLFKPICYSTGKCEFMADADRPTQMAPLGRVRLVGRPGSAPSTRTSGWPTRPARDGSRASECEPRGANTTPVC